MAGGHERESPRRGELTGQGSNRSKEQGGVHKESNAQTLLAPLMQGEQSGHERQQNELVKAVRGFIKQREEKSQLRLSPEKRISLELFGQTKAFSGNKDREISKERHEFFSRLKLAWDSLIYDRVKAERPGEWHIDMYWGYTDDGETVKLTHPVQVRLLDALTEAVGIPHERGQTVIEIPKNLKGKKEFLETLAYAKKAGRYP